jgi:hypothetical protein
LFDLLLRRKVPIGRRPRCRRLGVGVGGALMRVAMLSWALMQRRLAAISSLARLADTNLRKTGVTARGQRDFAVALHCVHDANGVDAGIARLETGGEPGTLALGVAAALMVEKLFDCGVLERVEREHEQRAVVREQIGHIAQEIVELDLSSSLTAMRSD